MSFALKIIKSDKEYEQAMDEFVILMDEKPGSPDYERYEMLALIIKEYEDRTVDIGLSEPIDAIKYSMDEMDLKQRDLIPIIGSAEAVSEILNRKRPLTFEMMKALSMALKIPPKVFFQQSEEHLPKDRNELFDQLPTKELNKRNWIRIPKEAMKKKEDIRESLSEFFSNECFFNFAFNESSPVFNKQHIRKGSKMDIVSLATWKYMALTIASKQKVNQYDSESITEKTIDQLAHLSIHPDGPLQAQSFLAENGIHLVILPHLKKTHIDGVAMTRPDTGNPVIALTLRYDRVDNFWFCLMHELGHVLMHLDSELTSIVDDLDNALGRDKIEEEADQYSADSLISPQKWNAFFNKGDYSPNAVKLLALGLRVHPAIIAGRIRHETRQWKILSRMVGHHEVRKVFGNQYYGLA